MINVRFVKSVYGLAQLPPADIPEVAFAGRSNVGKSSLINRLVNRRNLVKVSATPGKTRSLNFYAVNEKYYLVDLPGYGYARVPKTERQAWEDLINGYIDARPTLGRVFLILDIRHRPKQWDIEFLSRLRQKGKPFFLVYTKLDKLPKSHQHRQAALLDRDLEIGPESRILFSAKTGAGREKILAIIDEMLS